MDSIHRYIQEFVCIRKAGLISLLPSVPGYALFMESVSVEYIVELQQLS
jgi:hypothetical protein